MLSPGPAISEALALFETAEACYSLGRALAAAGRTDEACPALSRVIASCGPDSPPSLSYPETKPVYWARRGGTRPIGYGRSSGLSRLCDAQRARWPGDSSGGRSSWYPTAAQPPRRPARRGSCEVTGQMLAQWEWCDPFQDGACHVEHGATGPPRRPSSWSRRTGATSGTSTPAPRRCARASRGTSPCRCAAGPRRGGHWRWAACCSGVMGPTTCAWIGAAWAQARSASWAGPAVSGASGGAHGAGAGSPSCAWSAAGRRCVRCSARMGGSGCCVGTATLAVDGPWAAGLLGLGMVDRILFPGAPAGGAAIRFDSIRALAWVKICPPPYACCLQLASCHGTQWNALSPNSLAHFSHPALAENVFETAGLLCCRPA